MIKRLPKRRQPIRKANPPCPSRKPNTYPQKSIQGPIPKQNAKEPNFTSFRFEKKKRKKVSPSNSIEAFPNEICSFRDKAYSKFVKGSNPQSARTKSATPAAQTATAAMIFIHVISFSLFMNQSIQYIVAI